MHENAANRYTVKWKTKKFAANFPMMQIKRLSVLINKPQLCFKWNNKIIHHTHLKIFEFWTDCESLNFLFTSCLRLGHRKGGLDLPRLMFSWDIYLPPGWFSSFYQQHIGMVLGLVEWQRRRWRPFWSCSTSVFGKPPKPFQNFQIFQVFQNFSDFQNYSAYVVANFLFPSTLLKAQQ